LSQKGQSYFLDRLLKRGSVLRVAFPLIGSSLPDVAAVRLDDLGKHINREFATSG
jgi:hypothetical protein